MFKRVVVTLLLLLALVIIGCLQNTDRSVITLFPPTPQPTPEGDSIHGHSTVLAGPETWAYS